MIYKIIMDFTNLDEIIKILSNRFNIVFIENAIYICDKKFLNTNINYIKRLLKNNNLFILKIDETNLGQEPIAVQNWCKNFYVQRDVKRFEKERNEEIQNFMKILDDFEQNLESAIQEK